MPYWNVEVTRWANVCVKADTEEEALEKAERASGFDFDTDNTESKCFGRADEDCEDEDEIEAMKSGFDAVIE